MSTHEALKQALEALQLCLTQLYHDGVMIEPGHPKRIAATAAENCAVKIADILAAANAAQDGVPTDLQQKLANARYVVRMKDDYIAHLESQLSTARAEGFEQAAQAVKTLHATISDPLVIGAERAEAGHNTLDNAERAIRALQFPDQPVNAAEAKPITRYAMTCQFDDAGAPEAIAVASPNGKFVLYEDYAAPAPVDAQPTKTEPESKGQTTRKAFICKSCEGVYADEPVTQCDCVPGEDEFIEGTISYPAALSAPMDAQPTKTEPK